MKIEKELRLVHCSDNRIKKEYLLSGPVTRESAASCRDYGETRVVGGLKKPFFTFLIPECLNIKGIVGEPSIEVWYYPEIVGNGERFLALLLAGSGAGGSEENLREAHRQLLAPAAGRKK